MNRSEVIQVLEDLSGISINDIKETQSLYYDLGLDSLKIALLLSNIFPEEIYFPELENSINLCVKDIIDLHENRNSRL